MFDWVLSYFGFLGSFLNFWWKLISNFSHWWELPIFIFGFLLSSFFVLFLSWWIVLIFFQLVILFLSYTQRLLKIEIPIVGKHLEKSLKESEERTSRDKELLEKSLRNRVTIIWENRGKNQKQFTSEEFEYVIKVFGLHKEQQELRKTFSDEITFNIQKWSLIEKSLNTRHEMTDDDRVQYQQQYDEGKLETWFRREVRNS